MEPNLPPVPADAVRMVGIRKVSGEHLVRFPRRSFRARQGYTKNYTKYFYENVLVQTDKRIQGDHEAGEHTWVTDQ